MLLLCSRPDQASIQVGLSSDALLINAQGGATKVDIIGHLGPSAFPLTDVTGPILIAGPPTDAASAIPVTMDGSLSSTSLGLDLDTDSLSISSPPPRKITPPSAALCKIASSLGIPPASCSRLGAQYIVTGYVHTTILTGTGNDAFNVSSPIPTLSLDVNLGPGDDVVGLGASTMVPAAEPTVMRFNMGPGRDIAAVCLPLGATFVDLGDDNLVNTFYLYTGGKYVPNQHVNGTTYVYDPVGTLSSSELTVTHLTQFDRPFIEDKCMFPAPQSEIAQDPLV